MRALAFVVVAGCAQGGDTPPADAHLVDSIVIDAPDAPTLTTLSQTTSDIIEPLISRACNAGIGTAANNYYRVFDLAALGIATDFHVYKVSFGVEACHQVDTSAGVDVTVRIGTYSDIPGDTLSLAAMTVLASTTAHAPEVIETIEPPSTPGATVDAYFDQTLPAGSKILVEIDVPNGSSTHKLLIGANDDGESAPAYVLAPTCNIDPPKSISLQAGSPVNLLITVTGWF